MLPFGRDTTYAVDTEVESADLNTIQDSIVALQMQHQIMWSPIGSSFVGARTSDDVAQLFEADTTVNAEVYTNEAGIIANSPFPSLTTRVKAAAGPTNNAVIYPKDDGAGNNAWFDDLNDLKISMQLLTAVSDIAGGQDVGIGLAAAGTFGAGHPADTAGVHLMRGASFGNDNIYVGATRGTGVDTGEAGANDVWKLLKLVYFGLNTPEGIAAGNIAVAKFYIDGVLEGTVTASIPSGSTKLTPYFFHRDNGAAGDLDMHIGPVWINWSSLLLDF